MAEPKVDILIWIIYHVIISTFILIDLLVGFRRKEGLKFREAVRWTLIWVAIGVAFGAFVFYKFGLDATLTYYAVFVLEKTLSMDNIFVFAVIFNYFAVPAVAQPLVLYMGVIGAIVMRAAFIYGGLLLLEAFHWMVYVFGILLVYSGFKMWRGGAERVRIEHNPIIRWARKVLPITDRYEGSKFIVRSTNLMFTPLIVVLLAIESTDLMFAVDSVPAAIALVEKLPSYDLRFFLAYTANISAVLGLRALYFVIALTMFKFKYIGKGLSLILVFLGLKFFLSGVGIEVPVALSLLVVFSVLTISIIASVTTKKRTL